MRQRWKGWKVELYKEYIKDADPENPKTPVNDYNITSAQWEEFKQQKQSEKFKV